MNRRWRHAEQRGLRLRHLARSLDRLGRRDTAQRLAQRAAEIDREVLA